jgi:hypothetical protein
MEEQREMAAKAQTPEKSLQHTSIFSQMQDALDAATKEHAGITIAATPDAKLATAYAAWSKAKEIGDIAAIAKQAQRIVELKSAGALPPPAESMTQQNIPMKKFIGTSEDAASFGQRVIAPEMAAGREAAAAAQLAQPDTTEGHKQYLTQLEIDQMEAGRMDTKMPMQMTIPGTGKELQSQVVRGVGVEGKSIPELIADIQAAKETRNRSATIAAIEALRDARAKVANPPAPAGAATPDLITAQPTQVAAQQDAGISRGQAMAKLMQQKAPDAVEAAKGQVLSRLVTDIETTRGAPLERADRQQLHADAAPILDTLMAGPRTMTAARDAQTALDAIRNRLAVRAPVDTTVERVYPKETPREVPPEVAPDTRTTDMFPDEKTQAEQHAATEAAYRDLLANPDIPVHSRDAVLAAQHAADMEQARLGGEFRAHAEMESLYPAEAIRPTPRLPEQITKDGVTITREAAPPKQVILAKEGQPVALNADTLRATLPEGTQSQREAADAARVKAANAMAERLATQTSRETVQFKALQAAHDALVSKDANGDPITVEERKAILRAHMADPETKKDAKSAAKTALNKILRAEKYLEKRGDDSSERLVQAEEHAHLTRERIPELEARVKSKRKGSVEALGEARTRAKQLDKILKATAIAERETPAEIAAKKFEAETYLKQDRADALAYEGTTGALPQRKLGPLTRKGTMAGSPRTGDLETVPERALTNRNPVVQDGKVRTTGRQLGAKGMKEANKIAGEIVTKEPVPVEREGVAAAEDRLQNQLRGQLRDAEISWRAVEHNPRVAQEVKNKVEARYEALMGQVRKATDAMNERNAALREAPKEPQASKEDASATLGDKDLEAYDSAPDDAFARAGEDPFAGEAEASVMFRTSDKGGKGTNVEDVKRITEGVTKDWKALPEIRYVQHENELPLRLRGYIVKTKNEGNVPGMRDSLTGKVWMIGDNIHSEKDAVLTVLHEVAGHHGLREILGKKYDSVMQSIYDGNADARAKADAKMAKNDTLTKEIAVEEVLADMAEKAPKSNAVRRLLYELKKWAYQVLGLKNVSDKDLLQIVANARRYAETGKGKAAEEAAKAGAPTLRTAPNYGDYKDTPIASLSKEPVADNRSFFERVVKDGLQELGFGITDMRRPLMQALDAAAKATGDEHSAFQAKSSIRDADASTALVEAFMWKGSVEFYKDDKGFYGFRAGDGPSGMDVLAKAQDIPAPSGEAKFGMATNYMLAQRGTRVGADKLGIDVTQEQLNAILKQAKDDPALGKPLEAFRTEYNKYNELLVRAVAATGAVSKAKAEELLKHGDYVSMYREKDGKLEISFGDEDFVSMGDIQHTPFLHALKGGKAQIMPINESILYNTKLLVDMATINMAKRNVGHVLSFAGLPDKKMLIHEGRAPKGKEYLEWKEEPKGKDDTGERWIKLDTEGTVMDGVSTGLLLRSIEGFHSTMPTIVRWIAKLNDLLRAGITRLPAYMFRQVVKDPLGSASTSGLSSNPLTAVAKTMATFGKSLAGNTKELEDVNRHALAHSNLATGDFDDIIKYSIQMAHGDKPNAYRQAMNALDRASHNADAATRAQLYKESIARGLSEVEAVYRTRESMNQHKRGGYASVQFANRTLLFFNAGVQGINVAVEAARGNMPFDKQLGVQSKFFKNAFLLAAGGIAYAAAMDDNEEYKKLKPFDRYGNIHVPMGNSFFKFAYSFQEVGMPLALGQALFDSMKDDSDDKQIVKALFSYSFGAVPGSSSMGVPQGMKQGLELATNMDFGMWNPIVPQRLEGRSPEEQFSSTTPEAYKEIGKQIGFSPIKIQHTVDGLFGKAVTYLLQLGEMAASEGDVEKPTTGIERTPFLSGLFQNPYSSAEIESAYSTASKAKEANSTFNNLKTESLSPERIKRFYEEHKTELAQAKAAGQFTERMGELNKQTRIIQNLPKVSGDKKRDRIDKIEKIKRQLAEQYNRAFKRIEASVGV